MASAAAGALASDDVVGSRAARTGPDVDATFGAPASEVDPTISAAAAASPAASGATGWLASSPLGGAEMAAAVSPGSSGAAATVACLAASGAAERPGCVCSSARLSGTGACPAPPGADVGPSLAAAELGVVERLRDAVSDVGAPGGAALADASGDGIAAPPLDRSEAGATALFASPPAVDRRGSSGTGPAAGAISGPEPPADAATAASGRCGTAGSGLGEIGRPIAAGSRASGEAAGDPAFGSLAVAERARCGEGGETGCVAGSAEREFGSALSPGLAASPTLSADSNDACGALSGG